jgi:hypothetical protein
MMPTQAECQAVYDQLNANGFPNAAKQMTGQAHNNADFLAEVSELPPDLKAMMQACAGKTSAQMIRESSRNMTPAERKREKERVTKKAKAAKAGAKGQLAIQDSGTLSSQQTYNDIIDAIDEADALEGPFGFLVGPGLFGIPKWILYAAGGYVAYKAITGYAKAKGSR